MGLERRKICVNHVILVGRLSEEPNLIQNDQNQSRMVIGLAVPRTFRNSQGIYETDFLRCVLWNGIAKRTSEYCKKGDMVCVRGRLQVRSYEDNEMEKKYITEVIVESISFLGTFRYDQNPLSAVDMEISDLRKDEKIVN